MFKIVHFATGEYVVDEHGEEVCFNSEEELRRQTLDNRYIIFRKKPGSEEVIETFNTMDLYRFHKVYHNNDPVKHIPNVIPKYQFEVIETTSWWDV